MAIDQKSKGVEKAWHGGQKPVIGLDLIAEEQARQVVRWSPGHDDAHVRGEIGLAAITYVRWAVEQVDDEGDKDQTMTHLEWPFEPEAFKPSEDPIRNLQKAGALIASEIDRLLRLRAK